MTDSQERRISALLALRDGAAEGDHDQDLSPDQEGELERLRTIKRSLNALPDIEPDDIVWQKIQARTETGRAGGGVVVQAENRFRPAHAPIAMAAGLVLAVAVGFVTVDAFRTGPTTGVVASTDVQTSGPLNALHQRSRQLEPLLRNAGFGESDAAERAFRYRIADLDAQLAAAADQEKPDQQEVERLWGQRVALLESLAEVRRARVVLQPAVY